MTRTAIVSALLLLAVTIGVLLLPGSASAGQGVRVYGFVYDRTGLPVANASVTLLSDDKPLPTASNPATTDIHGYFEFPGIQQGSYCLVAEKNAIAYSTTIRLQTWDAQVNFNLQGSTADLADVRVTPQPGSPTAGQEIATPTPAASYPTPVMASTPGFDIALALLSLFLLGLAKRRIR
jgi:hypothetical protein